MGRPFNEHTECGMCLFPCLYPLQLRVSGGNERGGRLARIARVAAMGRMCEIGSVRREHGVVGTNVGMGNR